MTGQSARLMGSVSAPPHWSRLLVQLFLLKGEPTSPPRCEDVLTCWFCPSLTVAQLRIRSSHSPPRCSSLTESAEQNEGSVSRASNWSSCERTGSPIGSVLACPDGSRCGGNLKRSSSFLQAHRCVFKPVDLQKIIFKHFLFSNARAALETFVQGVQVLRRRLRLDMDRNWRRELEKHDVNMKRLMKCGKYSKTHDECTFIINLCPAELFSVKWSIEVQTWIQTVWSDVWAQPLSLKGFGPVPLFLVQFLELPRPQFSLLHSLVPHKPRTVTPSFWSYGFPHTRHVLLEHWKNPVPPTRSLWTKDVLHFMKLEQVGVLWQALKPRSPESGHCFASCYVFDTRCDPMNDVPLLPGYNDVHSLPITLRTVVVAQNILSPLVVPFYSIIFVFVF